MTSNSWFYYPTRQSSTNAYSLYCTVAPWCKRGRIMSNLQCGYIHTHIHVHFPHTVAGLFTSLCRIDESDSCVTHRHLSVRYRLCLSSRTRDIYSRKCAKSTRYLHIRTFTEEITRAGDLWLFALGEWFVISFLLWLSWGNFKNKRNLIQ